VLKELFLAGAFLGLSSLDWTICASKETGDNMLDIPTPEAQLNRKK